jgi:hypothetical protein
VGEAVNKSGSQEAAMNSERIVILALFIFALILAWQLHNAQQTVHDLVDHAMGMPFGFSRE